nr:ribonuclease H-like domain-containing protein [Tanacetum cinerariifolium]
DQEGVVTEQSGDDAPIKGRNLDEGEAAAERVSDDTKEMETVLTSMDAATVLLGGVTEVSTSSGSIPTAGPFAAEVRTDSDVEDVNLKFLRSLPFEWKTQTLIWRNKTDLEDKSLDDLFNSLKIYESEVKHSSSIGTDSHNLAFVSSTSTDSITDS